MNQKIWKMTYESVKRMKRAREIRHCLKTTCFSLIICLIFFLTLTLNLFTVIISHRYSSYYCRYCQTVVNKSKLFFVSFMLSKILPSARPKYNGLGQWKKLRFWFAVFLLAPVGLAPESHWWRVTTKTLRPLNDKEVETREIRKICFFCIAKKKPAG